MMGPPDYPDHPVTSWEQFLQDYAEHFFKASGDGRGRNFIITADGEEVGTIGYDLCDKEKSRAVLDIWLRGEDYCGRGYGTDALNTLCWHLFDKHGIRSFYISPSSRNKRAVAAYLKAGFHRVDLSAKELDDEFVRGVNILDYRDSTLMRRVIQK